MYIVSKFMPCHNLIYSWTEVNLHHHRLPLQSTRLHNGFHGILSFLKPKKSIQPTNYHTADQSICLPKTIQIMFSEKDKMEWQAFFVETLDIISTWAAPDAERYNSQTMRLKWKYSTTASVVMCYDWNPRCGWERGRHLWLYDHKVQTFLAGCNNVQIQGGGQCLGRP